MTTYYLRRYLFSKDTKRINCLLFLHIYYGRNFVWTCGVDSKFYKDYKFDIKILF